jgi:outer membrane protein assembly factor BamB
MPSFTRREALRAVPALGLGLGVAGCLGDDDEFPVSRAWHRRPREPSPVVANRDGTLVAGSYRVFEDSPLVAGLDAETGDVQWSVTVPKGQKSPVGTADGRAYAYAESGVLHAVDTATGEELWRHDIGAVTRADPGATEFAPLATGERVVVPVSGTEEDVTDRLHVLDAASGDEQFVHEVPSSLSGAPALAGDRILVPTVSGRLFALDADGEVAWERSTIGAPSAVAVGPADEVAAVGTPAERLLGFDTATGEVRWRGRLQNTVFARPLVTDDRVCVGGADFVLRAFDRETGTELWRDELLTPATHGPFRLGDRLVTLACGHHNVRGYAGELPFGPTVLYVHDRDGTCRRSVRFEGYLDGGEVRWLSVVEGDIYLGQAYGLTKLSPEVVADA